MEINQSIGDGSSFWYRPHLSGRAFLNIALIALIAMLALAALLAAGPAQAQDPSAEPLWSADMLVAEITSVAIGADGADHFSNIGGTGNLQIKSLWSYTLDRDLRLAFVEAVPGADDLTLQVGALTLEFPAGSSGQNSFKWQNVEVDWEDGQTIPVRIVPTSAPGAPQLNSPATGALTISGTAQAGETLTADTSGITDADGLENVSYSYQWLADDADITGVTESTYTLYTLTDAEVGKTIKVKVSFTDDAGNGETLTSEATVAVSAAANNPATGAPIISGTAQAGETLTADTSGMTDDDGLDEVQYAHQWLADDANLEGATGSSYTLTDDEVGKTIKVKVSFTDDANNQESLTSVATTAVTPQPNSPATGLPTISGTAQVDETLTAYTSGIADQDGLTNVSYSYQWLADDANLEGATGSSYTLTDDEVGKAIRVKVTFTDDRNNKESLTSATTAAVTARANSPATGLPTISGTAQVGKELTADTSDIADPDGMENVAFNYQWIRHEFRRGTVRVH